MSRSLGMTMLFASFLAAGACGKGDDKKDETAKTTEGTATKTAPTEPPKTDTPAANADPGVEAGGIERDKDEGPAAVITQAEGTVEVRRVGETEYQPAKSDTQLFPGDQVRTSEKSTATITMADESVVEVAEVSSVGITSREGSADPASGAAVLSGLARFTVSARAPGEGAFRVYTPAGVVLTKGTVYGIGVAATGEARIGVETGAVEVVGLAALDAEPVVVEAGNATVLSAAGSPGQATAWAQDDWGTWRAEADAQADVKASFQVHSNAMAELNAQLAAAYADLEAQAQAMAELEAKAAAAAEAKATADYEIVAPEAAATVEASFGVASFAEALTWSYAGHATLAYDIYVRHPDTVTAEWQVAAPRVEAAILWPKRFEVTSAAYLEPLRVQYYVHHPRGRAHAELVGVAVPEFYAAVNVPEPEPAKVRGRVKVRFWAPPVVIVKAQARPVWISAPRPNWRAKVKVKAAPPRAKVAWYVRPPTIKTSIFLGAAAKAEWKPSYVVKAPEPRANLRAHFRVQAPAKRIVVKAPDLNAAAKARMKVKLDAGGRVLVRDHRGAAAGAAGGVDVKAPDVKVRDHRDAAADVKGKVGGGVDIKTGVDVKAGADIKGGAGVKVRDHRDAAGAAGADVKVKVRDHRDAAGKATGDAKATVKGGADAAGDAKAGVKVKVKAPEPPKVKVKAKGEVKGGIKIGN